MKKNSQAFVNQLLVCLLVTIFCGGSVGLGIVWMRHQISTTAQTNRTLAARIAEIERHIYEKTAQIESEQNHQVLRRRNQDWKLGLVPISDPRVGIMPVTVDPVLQMAARANRELFRRAAAGEAGPTIVNPFVTLALNH